MHQQKLQNATATLVLGIFSILSNCCIPVLPIILGVIALVISKKDKALYEANPQDYSDYGNLSAGRITAIIGIVLGILGLLYTIFVLVTIGYSGFMEEVQRQMDAGQY